MGSCCGAPGAATGAAYIEYGLSIDEVVCPARDEDIVCGMLCCMWLSYAVVLADCLSLSITGPADIAYLAQIPRQLMALSKDLSKLETIIWSVF